MVDYSQMIQNVMKSNISKSEKMAFMKLIHKKMDVDEMLNKIGENLNK